MHDLEITQYATQANFNTHSMRLKLENCIKHETSDLNIIHECYTVIS